MKIPHLNSHQNELEAHVQDLSVADHLTTRAIHDSEAHLESSVLALGDCEDLRIRYCYV